MIFLFVFVFLLLPHFKDVIVNSNNICKCLFANILVSLFSFFLVH